jgi:uncharacterized membrane protein YsdA (DUF1294 family)
LVERETEAKILIIRGGLSAKVSSDLALVILLLLAVLNILIMLLFRHDKVKAREGGRRISERTLLILAFFAPFGAVYGMLRFRHKTRHLKFLLVYVFMLFQIVVVSYILYIVI